MMMLVVQYIMVTASIVEVHIPAQFVFYAARILVKIRNYVKSALYTAVMNLHFIGQTF